MSRAKFNTKGTSEVRDSCFALNKGPPHNLFISNNTHFKHIFLFIFLFLFITRQCFKGCKLSFSFVPVWLSPQTS